MYVKQLFAGLGLFLDLLGASLLSVPMVWDINKFVVWLSGVVKWIHKVLGTVVGGSVLVICWMLAASIPVVLIRSLLNSADPMIKDATGNSINKVIPPISNFSYSQFAISFVLWLVIAALPLIALRVLLSFAEWIQAGDKERERKVGRIGLGFLVVGFFVQAIINFMPNS